MSNFKLFLIIGLGVGVLGGGTIALFSSGKKPAPAATPALAAAPPPQTPTQTPTPGPAPSPPALPDQAAELNEQGKKLMFAGKFDEASRLFRDAVARVPEPKYFFNLGTSLFQEGKFEEALTALDAVPVNHPTPQQRAKTAKLRAKVLAECKSQGIECLDKAPKPALIAGEAGELNDRGKAAMRGQHFDEASQLFWRAFELEPDPRYGLNVARALFQSSQMQAALSVLGEMRQREATPELWINADRLRGTILEECRIAREVCETTVGSTRAANAIAARILDDEGRRAAEAGDFAAAASKFREALELVKSAGYTFDLAGALFRDGKLEEALAVIDTMSTTGASGEQLAPSRDIREKILGECRARKVSCVPAPK